MKKKVFLIVILCMFAWAGIAIAGDLSVKMSSWHCYKSNAAIVEIIIFNNTSKPLGYMTLSIILLNNESIVGSKSRPITDIPNGEFKSKSFYIKTNSRCFYTSWRWSITELRYD